MIWHSVSDFFYMGGYAFYVWGSFVVCALALVIETLSLRYRHRAIIRRLKALRDATS